MQYVALDNVGSFIGTGEDNAAELEDMIFRNIIANSVGDFALRTFSPDTGDTRFITLKVFTSYWHVRILEAMPGVWHYELVLVNRFGEPFEYVLCHTLTAMDKAYQPLSVKNWADYQIVN